MDKELPENAEGAEATELRTRQGGWEQIRRQYFKQRLRCEATWPLEDACVLLIPPEEFGTAFFFLHHKNPKELAQDLPWDKSLLREMGIRRHSVKIQAPLSPYVNVAIEQIRAKKLKAHRDGDSYVVKPEQFLRWMGNNGYTVPDDIMNNVDTAKRAQGVGYSAREADFLEHMWAAILLEGDAVRRKDDGTINITELIDITMNLKRHEYWPDSLNMPEETGHWKLVAAQALGPYHRLVKTRFKDQIPQEPDTD